ncbi:MAG: FAD-dependent oxidoreductase [Sediminibacterium sp.]|nr:FAD-dependent oxidoreductase [Sediminibacterium sp.]
MKIHVIGGGIIGLSSAYFLHKKGYEVTIIDRNEKESCSLGNMGYICPSHFIPLANPGVIYQGIRWLLKSTSPFYIKPQWNKNFFTWLWHFWHKSNQQHVNSSNRPLYDISVLSQHLYTEWLHSKEIDFPYFDRGICEVFIKPETAKKLEGMCKKANELGMKETRMIDRAEYINMEGGIETNGLGALYFKEDAHTNPEILMQKLKSYLLKNHVQFITDEINQFKKNNKEVHELIGKHATYSTDYFVIAAGAASMSLFKQLNLNIPLVGGRGYSYTNNNSDFILKHPAILVEGRTAITPLGGNSMRYGGTMEITKLKTPPKPMRIEGIYKAIEDCYPSFQQTPPPIENVWFGYRPCSADGLPYLGKISSINNLIIATGHAMVGLSLGAASGLLVSELIQEQKTSISISAFNPERFM